MGLLPKSWQESIEKESREWMVRCPNCAAARSVWDMGGVRWKAAGRKWTWLRCQSCGKSGWHTISRDKA